MRKYVKRGSVSSKVQYKKLKDLVWKEFEQLEQEQLILHDSDVKEIALIKATELGLTDFKVTKLIFLAITLGEGVNSGAGGNYFSCFKTKRVFLKFCLHLGLGWLVILLQARA